MYERFTDRARKVLQLANQEAHRSNDEYIGTEHLLLGILQEGTGTAVATLQTFQVGFQEMTQQIESMIRSSRQTATSSEMPTSREMPPPAKQVIEYAMDEARALAPDSKSIGTETSGNGSYFSVPTASVERPESGKTRIAPPTESRHWPAG